MVSVDALVAYATELEEETGGSGVTWLKAKRTEALTAMSGTGSGFIMSTTVDGQSYQRRFEGSAMEWFDATTAALAQMAGTAAKITYPTFSGIPH